MINCKVALEEGSSCGKQTCCLFCDERTGCPEACDVIEGCKEQVEVLTDLQVIQSTVPDVLKSITELTVQKKKIEEQEKQMKKKLLEAMELHGIKSFENESVKFMYVAPTTRKSVDSTKLKKEHPDIYEECQKTSNVSASVRITVK